MTASQRKLRAGGIEHGPLVRIMSMKRADGKAALSSYPRRVPLTSADAVRGGI